MSTFVTQTTITPVAPLDPFKHVNYTLGMVLGVDDLNQEFAYLTGRDQWLTRDLIGYGTVCGLRVTSQVGDEGPQVMVEAGTAVNPRGQIIRVPAPQCARLNDWLAAHQTELLKYAGSPPDGEVRLYVVLCYRECPTDNVPVPGEPCRSEDELMAASRLQDDYQLELRFVPPDQRQEDATREFVAWLRQIEIVDVADSPDLRDAFEEAVRQAVPQLSSPPTSPPTSPPDYILGSPPEWVVIPKDAVCDYLRLAFLLWTTELRPLWLGLNQSCAGVPPDEECVLLAELTVPFTAAGQVANSPKVEVYEEQRPYLLPLRLLQEWLLCGWNSPVPADSVIAETAFDLLSTPGIATAYSRADHTHGTPPNPIPPHQADPDAHVLAGDVTGSVGDTTVKGIHHFPVEMPSPPESGVLAFQGDRWEVQLIIPSDTVESEVTHNQPANAGDPTTIAYSRADHTHGTPPDPIPVHVADLHAHDTHNIAGDVTGNIVNTVVERIRTVKVAAVAPVDDQVLIFQGGEWRPADPSSDAVPSDVVFGQAGDPGTLAQYSRGDHTHSATFPPVAGDFVEHPPGLPHYAIVAAGIVSGDELFVREPVYNKLSVQGVDDGFLRVQFDGYQQPDDTFQYIVKALLVDVPETFPKIFGIAIPTVMFHSFQSEYFQLSVWVSSLVKLMDSNGNPIIDPNTGDLVSVIAAPVPVNADDLRKMEFMIEVSRFEGEAR